MLIKKEDIEGALLHCVNCKWFTPPICNLWDRLLMKVRGGPDALYWMRCRCSHPDSAMPIPDYALVSGFAGKEQQYCEYARRYGPCGRAGVLFETNS